MMAQNTLKPLFLELNMTIAVVFIAITAIKFIAFVAFMA
jgi:hypothetical protein